MRTAMWIGSLAVVSALGLLAGCEPAAKHVPDRPTTAKVAQTSIKVPHHLDRVGDLTENEKTDKVEVVLDGKRIKIDKRTRIEQQTLAIEAGVPVKARVKYLDHAYAFTVDGVDVPKPSLVGKTYLLTHSNGVTLVTSELGEVPSDEQAVVVDDHKSFGTASAIKAVITDRSWAIGTPFAVDPKILAQKGESEASGTMTLTLSKVDGVIATFQVKGEVTKEGMTVISNGELTIDLRHGVEGAGRMSADMSGAMEGHQDVVMRTTDRSPPDAR